MLIFAASVVSASSAEQADTDELFLATCPAPGYIRFDGTCLSISGYITAEHSFSDADDRIFFLPGYAGGLPIARFGLVPNGSDRRKTETTSYLTFLSASETEWGMLRTRLSLEGELLGSGGQTLKVDQAYFTLAGFDLGRGASYFNLSDGYTYTGGYAADDTIDLAAYTYGFTNGSRITLSLEDSSARRLEDGIWAKRASPWIPDIVLNAINADETFGVSGALTHIRDARTAVNAWGFAVAAGYEHRWSPGGRPARLAVVATYAKGALGYLGYPDNVTDYLIDADGGMVLSSGYAALASVQHDVSEQTSLVGTASGYSVETDARFLNWRARGLRVSLGVIRQSAGGLTLGLEGNYHLDEVSATDIRGQNHIPADGFELKVYVRRSF
ncbi:hypothetical protein FQ775_02250 [Nitratireductor mangrovi]|uniref:Porin n=1 Tax=Nitratireductor mangrovi TaxID=2599600 RepID=A0A5B8KUJ3_9HYPH|nr:hypothetical protein FQ775_02250 [Nitratireductor mangrovi]